MTPQRLFQRAPCQSICLFCVHRLRNQTGLGPIQIARRSFSRSERLGQHAGQANPVASFPNTDVPQTSRRSNNAPAKREVGEPYTRSDTLGVQSNRNWGHELQENRSARQQRVYNSGQWENTSGESREHWNSETGSEKQTQWGHLRRRRRSQANTRPESLNDSGDVNIIQPPTADSLGRPSADQYRRTGFVGLKKAGQRTEYSEKSSMGAISRERGANILQSTGGRPPDEPLISKTSVRGFDLPRGRRKHIIQYNWSDPKQPTQVFSNTFEPDSNVRRSDFRNERVPSKSTERDPVWEASDAAVESWTPQSTQPDHGGSSFVDYGQWSGAPRTYNATPRRRSRGDMASKSDRRAEKFDFSENDADYEDFGAKAQKEERKRRRREKAEAAREASEKKIELPAFISVANLATALKIRVETFVKKLEELGFEEVANDHVLNFENASLVAMEFNYQPVEDRSGVEDLKPRPEHTDMSILPKRPPIVTIMGHVDHGKTTLLDFLRKSSVAAQEHGGITQHIGAFSVPLASGKLITFLDTPGHAAFLSMRQRGANVTDIVILVVAADDSVKPQTIEAIKHAKAAKVPIIVAINKIDKDEANVERVKQDLLRYEVEVEDFGGDVQAYPVSGKTGEGVAELVEAMVTQAEIIDMRAETDGAAEGWVLEATTKKAGRIATVLVRRGTLRPGNIIVAGTTWARIRTLKNEAGVQVQEATPGMPVEVDGWRDQPIAGDEVLEAQSEQKASSVVAYRNTRLQQIQAAKDMEVINENRRLEMEKREREKEEREAATQSSKDGTEQPQPLPNASETSDAANTELYFIIKADVSGSAEAVEGSITALPLSNQPIHLNILRTGVGPVSEFDIDHASAVPSGEGFIVSFNQQVPTQISAEAEKAGVKILDENIIYKVTDEVRAIVESKLPPLITKRVIGEAEAAQVFEINTGGRKFSKVAGCKVRNGVIDKRKKVRVYRGAVGDDTDLIYDGTISSLKSHKKDVTEMRKGSECGVSFEAWQDFQAGDVLQCYEEKSEPRRLT